MDADFATANATVLEEVATAAAAEARPARGPESAACTVATRNYENQRRWVERYNTIVFVVAAAVAISVIVLIVMLVIGKNAGAIAGAIGTVVTGAAMGFVLDQRKDAREQLEMFRQQRDAYCGV